MNRTFVLTYIKKGKSAVEVYRHELPAQVQRYREVALKNPKYWGGRFEVRTLNGFKAKNILKDEKHENGTPKQ